MTVSAAYTPAVYTADGTANQFNFGFSALRTQDVWLVEHDKDTGAIVREFQGGSGLTVSLVSGFVIINDYDERPLAGNKVTVYRRTQATQTVDLDPTVPVSSDAVEGMSDKLTLLAQEAQNFGDDYTDLQQYAAEALTAQLAAEDARDDAVIAQGAAESARDLAIGAKNAAAISAGNALTSENNASDSEDAAALSAAAALVSEGNASDSEDAAALSAAAALVSEGNASDSEDAAALSLADFEKMYLGPKAADPTVDNEGGALIEGALYWNTTTDDIRVWDGSAWVVTTSAGALPRNGTLPMTGQFQGVDGSAGTPAFSFASDPDSGFYRIGANNFGIATGGAVRLSVDNDKFDSLVPFRAVNGSESAPSFSFQGGTGSGMYLTGGGLAFAHVGAPKIVVAPSNIVLGEVLLGVNGSATAPAFGFTSDTDTGMYRTIGGLLSLTHSGADKLLVSGTSITSVVPLQGTDGSAAAPTFSFANDTNTGIYRSGTDTLSIAAGGGEAFRVGSTGCAFVVAGTTTYTATASGFIPNPDNVRSLGVSGVRWTEVYATTGTINTSDAREKTAVEPMSKHEIAAAKALAREIGTFQWLESIEKKGDGARRHVGLTVQRAIEIMESHDLDPFSYAFICYDEWEADEEQNREAGDRYSFRTDQLNLFIARGLEARITALEAALR